MNQSAACPTCGARLQATAGAGSLCPRCLLGAVVEVGEPGAEADDLAAADTLLGEIGWARRTTRVLALLRADARQTSYLARQEDVARFVVLDVWKGGAAHPAAGLIDARVQELMRLDLPGVVPVLDGGITSAGHCCLVSRFTGGVPIAQYFPNGVPVPSGRADLLDEARHTLEAIHESGVIHGHVSAETLLAAEVEGRPVAQWTGFALLLPRDASAAADLDAFDQLVGQLRSSPGD